MKLPFVSILFIGLSFLSFGQHIHTGKSDSSYVTDHIEVLGKVRNSMTLSVASLQKMHVIHGKNVSIVCQSGEEKKKIQDFKGVLLRDIIDSAGVLMKNKKDRGKFIIVVTASDQYKVVFSYNELYFGAAGDSIYIAFEENGKPLLEEGKMIIFSSTDKVSGPRHVKWVKSIEVMEIE